MKIETESEEIAVEVRLSDVALARRIHEWLEASPAFVLGMAESGRAVMIADHVPDDAAVPIVLLAVGGGLAAWPYDTRVAARLEPDAGPAKLRIAVEAAAHGLTLNDRANWQSADAGGLPTLSGRELEVLRFIVAGASNKAIARALRISTHTVKFHTAAILGKLGASTRTGAAIEAIRLGLVML